MSIFLRATALAVAVALGGCAVQGPAKQVDALAPRQWQAPLPHNGSRADLATWWRGQADGLLVELIESAQAVSPTVASAASRIAQSRSERVAAGAALAPNVDAAASVNRSNQQSALPMGTTSQAALNASWEIDLFGANRAARDAAQARLESAHAGWHDARVSVAAEVANQYYGLRACQQLLTVAQQDAVSRADTAKLTELSAKAGFQSPASLSLARASAADGNSRYIAQRAACDVDVKVLSALTAIAEPQLRQKLAAGTPAVAPAIAIAELPAQTLSQRPDVFTAEREVAAASADVGNAQAQRYPRLSLSGSVGVANFRAGGDNTKTDTWTIGPLSVSVPVFDAGRRAANVDAASARYDAAVSSYRATVRNAVSEVEQAMVNLDATGARAGDAQTALEGYRANYSAVEDRYKNGMASLFELEDARRTRLAAEQTVINLQRERSAAWVALYRAAGGGWNPSAPALAAN
ncbi:efflux transporter, outer membrane factor (OMF) lipoprotein, NodT family [Duganella sp. CF402]|uniref:efflux transporter outer membrane subunit n=1 Tax=unclassified Duganella TaxID=2636909 RepID=UPI0008D155A0|nr:MULTISPECIES: efflux transporter outer membrane subunit [unclassified Duganella]RZT08783.1 NodT family efflux transporter outer membrane factor (OMF) lipoprotein [Duganella sp. BK701]SEL82209.1 efflux transporter, outer membrane factor (OMF) lipoprotein, NodT family [Duganella sp. CF402]